MTTSSLDFFAESLSLDAVTDVKVWNAAALCKPFDLALNYTSHMEQGRQLSGRVKVHTEAILASFNTSDLALMSSIFARAALVRSPDVYDVHDSNPDTGPDPIQDADIDSLESVTSSDTEPPSMDQDTASKTDIDPFSDVSDARAAAAAAEEISISPFDFKSSIVWNFDVNFGSLTVTVINDFDKSNIPLVRLAVEECALRAEGLMATLQGSFASIMRLDYFNAVSAYWEPVLETVTLDFLIAINAPVVTLNVNTAHDIRLNITGSILQSMLQVLNPIRVANQQVSSPASSHSIREGGQQMRHLEVNNCLGIDVRIGYFESGAASTSVWGTDTVKSATIDLATGASDLLALPPQCKSLMLNSEKYLPLTGLPIRVQSNTLFELHVDVSVGTDSETAEADTELASLPSRDSALSSRYLTLTPTPTLTVSLTPILTYLDSAQAAQPADE